MPVSLELLSRPAPRPDLFEDLLVAVHLPQAGGASSLVDADALNRWAIPPATHLEQPTPEAVAAEIAEGRGVEVDPWILGAHDAADLVIAATHAGVGFGPGLQPRARTAEQVWTMLDAAVAALTGEDVKATWEAAGAGDGRAPTGPSAARRGQIAGLPRSAREAIRDVVTIIRVPEADLEQIGDLRA